MIIPNIWKNMFETTNQLLLIHQNWWIYEEDV